ncbi:hypothetical protein Taro_050034 [Colocasia esculenta]|uniref:Uncharacterized protein n=1 Tax=Colocasia esculenta TaxID=4460 RepID=A0A843XCM4_COLES|nr:hypothetical protein [Colocasia esculenta]
MEDKEIDHNKAVVLQSPPTTWKTPHPKGKKRTNVNPLRVALFLFRRHASAGNKEPLHVQVVKPGGRGLWKTLVAAMRLLHHHHQGPQLPEQANAAPASTALVCDASEPFVSAPPSPTLSDDGMSRYASANNLQELDTGASDEEEEGTGDDTIDARAEEFIAKFYEQIRLQRLQSTNGD